ncbi:MAG: Type 1 glutamine amidotransferase-like domain-containing protein [Actinomycetes bacterium]
MSPRRPRQILATSGGFLPSDRGVFVWRPGPLVRHAIALSSTDQAPRVCYVGTASGDSLNGTAAVTRAFSGTDVRVSVLELFPMPNLPDLRAHLLAQDVIWVGGGSVANLLALWRLHGLDVLMREAWESGVVLAGVSAGSICWHIGGTTDSYGPQLRAVTDGLGLLPYGNGVHYDNEPARRPLLHELVGSQTLPLSFATDDGVGLHYVGTELAEVVSDRPEAYAWRVERTPDGQVVETRLDPRLLAPGWPRTTDQA